MPANQLPEADLNRLLEAARATLGRAHAPYSKFRVGAAVLTDAGEIFTGVNVENASYGLTNCAERSAIFTAVRESRSANLKLCAVAVVTADDVPCSPCGACRQVISEFGGDDCRVIFKSAEGYLEMSIKDLLPFSFRLS
ncbi:MAG TPA: cytidine deaminase [Candidatus Limnocylindrales bacterium]|jgi:cytidine deaminase|nr:cytidine deaminase [Candidatus Limnocylindrales bacterium]